MNIKSEVVLTVVSQRTGVDLADIRGPRKATRFSWPRMMAAYLMARYCNHLSLPDIADALHRADHTSIINAYRRWPEIEEKNPLWLAMREACEREMCGTVGAAE